MTRWMGWPYSGRSFNTVLSLLWCGPRTFNIVGLYLQATKGGLSAAWDVHAVLSSACNPSSPACSEPPAHLLFSSTISFCFSVKFGEWVVDNHKYHLKKPEISTCLLILFYKQTKAYCLLRRQWRNLISILKFKSRLSALKIWQML